MERFVITSDHGFLLQDSTVENAEFGKDKRAADRRYAMLDQPSGKPDVLEVRLSMLEYTAAKDAYLVFAPDTRLWKTQETVQPFVHGGKKPSRARHPCARDRALHATGRPLQNTKVVANARAGAPPTAATQTRGSPSKPRDSEPRIRRTGKDQPRAARSAARRRSRADRDRRGAARSELGSAGRVLVTPNRAEAVVEFEIEGPVDDRVQVEIYPPDAIAEVTPKIVEGFFDVAKVQGAMQHRGRTGHERAEGLGGAHRRRGVPPRGDDCRGAAQHQRGGASAGARLADAVRAFARSFDKLVQLLPFEVEVLTVNGMKVYSRKASRFMGLRDAAHIFQRLRNGTVPDRGLEAFAEGTSSTEKRAPAEDRRGERWRGRCEFLRGGYGCGKTFMANLVLHDAQQSGFVTSFVVVSDNDLHFYKFDELYRKVVSGLSTPACAHGALGDILDRWIGGIEEGLLALGMAEDDPALESNVLAKLDEHLGVIAGGQAPGDMVRVVRKNLRAETGRAPPRCLGASLVALGQLERRAEHQEPRGREGRRLKQRRDDVPARHPRDHQTR